nr:hypothetical protein [Tanacetum cinerariifolium]
MESVLKENDCLLKHALGADIVNIVVNDCMNVYWLTVDACEQCVTTESELKTYFIKKENYETDNASSSESAPTVAELFETNELKAQIQEKDTVNVVPLIPKLRKNRTTHIDYLKHTLEEAATLRELVESERLLSP